ncbi:MAG TPA: hypothetical protein VFM39_07240 [bacterium]|nr:hypothetical protein [bacterium]
MTDIVWPFRQALRAECIQHHCRHTSKAPDDNCSCGIYAFRDRNAAEQSHERYITGRVAVWGDFVEHALGWRAEFAYPLELWIPDVHWEHADALMDVYGVAVHTKDVLCANGPTFPGSRLEAQGAGDEHLQPGQSGPF